MISLPNMPIHFFDLAKFVTFVTLQAFIYFIAVLFLTTCMVYVYGKRKNVEYNLNNLNNLKIKENTKQVSYVEFYDVLKYYNIL
jgi:hypothetical protein